MLSLSDIRKGLKIEMDGAPWNVVDFQFVKPGKGQAFTRTRLKNLITGNVVERTFKISDKLEAADVGEVNMQYMYNDGETYYFMNLDDFDTVGIPAGNLEGQAQWLIEQMPVRTLIYNGRPISIEIPNFVELEITYCEPGVKGNTATGSMKTATLSTGATVQVPLFMEQNSWIKIDTRTGEYVERVNK